MEKISYKIQNWSTYNRSLKNRGNITLWFTEESLSSYFAVPSKSRGRPCIYSESAIILCLTIRTLFQLPLRAVQGYMEGLFELMGVAFPVPDYTTLSRRCKNLNVNYKLKNKSEAIDLVIDSTGLKIYGEGEWKVRMHGYSKRRTWRKLHLAVDPADFQVEVMKLTPANRHDGKVLPLLMKEVEDVEKVFADAAYMEKDCFDSIADKGATALIDLRGGTSLARNPSKGLEQRNNIVKGIWDSNGNKKEWQKKSGYHRRSLVETQMYRIKTIFGPKLKSRSFVNQENEAKIMVMALNKMTLLGMPQTLALKTG